MKEKKIFTADDIERYHSGQLSAAESHTLEKAALDDPFLADALEGYAFTGTASKDLAKLQQRVEKRVEKNERGKVVGMGLLWLKIAAVVTVIAGSAWLIFYTLGSTAEEKNLAVLPSKQPAPIQAAPSESADSTAVAQNNTTATYKMPDINEDKSSTTKQEYASNAEKQAATGRTKEENRAVVSVMEEEKKTPDVLAAPLVKTDSSSYPLTTETSKSVLRKRTGNDTIRNVDVVMQATELDAKDVVVLNNSKPKSALRKSTVTIDTLEPAKGWTNFDDYIATNIKSPKDLQIKPVSGEVELSFDINNDGQPVNIAVTKSLCDKCDEEAIRLLKQGPKWKKVRKKGSVTIRF